MPRPGRVQKPQLNRKPIDKMERETPRGTNILDLNDYCMREVFQHLELTDLVAVADVCSRFRENAQAYFAISKYTRLYLEIRDTKLNNEFLEISKTMRNFGAFAKSIHLSVRGRMYFLKLKLYPSIIGAVKLIRRHCTDKLTELSFHSIRIPGRVIRMLRPFFHQLKALSVSAGEGSGLLLENFPKLESFSMKAQKLHEYDFKGFFQRSSRVKKIRIVGCTEIDYNIFRSIATYVPHIEDLNFAGLSQQGGTFDDNYKHLMKLSKLTNLALDCVDGSLRSVILTKMGEANIPVENLRLWFRYRPTTSQEYVDGILGLKKLKRLTFWGREGLFLSDILSICKHHSELREIHFYDPVLTIWDLLEILRNNEKLQWINCDLIDDDYDVADEGGKDGYFMHVEYYVEIIKVLKNRRERTHLRLTLSTKGKFTSDIPEELINKYKRILTMEMNWQ